MAGFIRKKVESFTLGEKLRRLREEADISLAEIAKSTKIRIVYLEMIEDGRYDVMPADVYIKGFLKSYASYLGLDHGEVLKQYEKERGVQNSIKKHKEPAPSIDRFRFPSITITPRMFTVAAFLFLIFGGFFYFYREIGKFSETPRLVIMQPSSDTSIDGSTYAVVGVTDRENKVTINEQPVLVNDQGEFNETLSLQQGLNTIVIKSLNRFGKSAEKVYTISARYDAVDQQIAEGHRTEQVAGVQTEAPEKVIVEIRIEDAPTWVSIDVDGTNVQSGTMLSGSQQRFEANEKISVTSGKANKTIITLNGQEIGRLGDQPGIVRDVIFTRDTRIMPEPSMLEHSTDSGQEPDASENNNEGKKDKKNTKRD